jgi:tetratricopeptide (TPR) repeat protein
MAAKIELTRADKRHLDAAEGWVELGNHLEANEELECITPQLRAHPDVLHVRYRVLAAAKKWEMAAEVAQAIAKLVPTDSFGFFHLAYALHELKRTKEARDVLLPIVDKFPDDYLIRFNLACYFCQLGKLKEAWRWLEKAIDLADTKELKLMALNDPDLQPLWAEISQI